MAEAQAMLGGSYPALTRHPDLQAIRQAQNQLLIDPSFMRSLMGGMAGFGQAPGAGMQQPQKRRPGDEYVPPHRMGVFGRDQMQARPAPMQGAQAQFGGKT